jgi:hypothetical protein
MDVALLAVDPEFCGHWVHAPLPVVGLYVEGAHDRHGLSVYPALQIHALIDVATEFGWVEPAGHAMQVLLDVAPTVLEYCC